MYNVFSNVVEQDHLKLCMMITSIMLYMFIQVLLFLIQFQCHWRIWKNMNFVFSIVNVSTGCLLFIFLFLYILFLHFIISFGKFGPPILQEQPYPGPTSECWVFSCFHNPPSPWYNFHGWLGVKNQLSIYL